MGPLADLLVKLAAKHPETVAHFDQLNGIYKALTGSAIKTEQLHSTMGRIIGRAVRCCVLKDTLAHQWKALVDNIGKGDTTAYIKAEIPADKEFRGWALKRHRAACSPTGSSSRAARSRTIRR